MNNDIEKSERQDNLSALSITQNTFEEIWLLYAAFLRNPSDGESLLKGLESKIYNLKSEYDRLERLKKRPFVGPSKIIFLGLTYSPTDVKRVSGDDVLHWLYIDRIQAILNRDHSFIHNEIGNKSRDDRTMIITKYQDTLEKLLSKLTEFDGITVDNFPGLVDIHTAAWSDIYAQLNDFVFLIRHSIEQYQYEIDIWLNTELETGKKKKSNKKKSYTSFEDLFIDFSYIEPSIDALRKISSPLISDRRSWIGGKRNQSAIVAWIEVLETRDKIKKIDRVELSKLLNNYFNGLELETNTASIFGKLTRKRNMLHADFLTLIK